jgi:hypothetical protein
MISVSGFDPGTKLWYHCNMSKKYRRILKMLFTNPQPAGINWKDVEALLKYLKAEISEGRGSRIRIVLRNRKAIFHRPHPRKEIDKGAVKSIRLFLENAGVNHDEI